MSQKLMGQKAGMIKRFDKNGNVIPCTVILAEPNVVTQIKSKDVDGYDAVQTGFREVREKRVSKPRGGHFKKAGVSPRRFLCESRVEGTELKVGDEVKVDLFKEGDLVDVMGTSKGKGFQGVMKLHGFSGGPAAHGSGFHRHAGSTGMRSTPGWCLPGGKRPSQMGNRRVTTERLKIITVDVEKGIILVQGAIPGATDALVIIRSTVKVTT